MKKLISFICMTMILLSLSITALAGSIPEDLLMDQSQIFFAEVVYTHLDKEKPDIEFSPVKKIKGDVKLGSKQTAYNFNTVGDFELKEGNVYLFTYFDENNPTDIFEVTSYDTSTLKLKNVTGDMWERFEKYLNEGRYEEAEHARLDKQNENLPVEGEPVYLTDLLGIAKEDAEKVNIHYNGEAYEIDVDKFYKAIDGIMLTDIKDVGLEKEQKDGVFQIPNAMYITVNGFDGYAYITDDCKVDHYAMHHSDMPVGAYTIKFVDRAKIMALFSDDAFKLPPLERPIAKDIFYGVLIGVLCGAVAGVIIYFVKKKNKKVK